MNTDKVAALAGFAIRSGKILFGLDRIEASRGKRNYLLIMDKAAGANTAKNIYRIAAEKKIMLLLSEKPLAEVVHKKNCKVIAILDENIAKGIMANLNRDYTEVK